MSQPQPNAAKKQTDAAATTTASAPKKTGGTRSRTGCWTCRARRKKCDEKRPACTPCVSKGLTCAGYGARLKWGNGVASRGYLTGKSVPVFEARGDGPVGSGPGPEPGSAPSGGGAGAGGQQIKAKGRDAGGGDGERGTERARSKSAVGGQEIVLDFAVAPAAPAAPAKNDAPTIGSDETATTKSTTSQEVDSSPPRPPVPDTVTLPGGLKLSGFDQQLFEEFKEWGAFYLWVSADPTKPPFYDVLSLCAHSRSLLANCLTFQLSLHPEYEDKFETYYAESLRLFRQDVCEPDNAVKDATLVSGILLCSIGMTRCITWTIHLSGMYSILQYRGAIANPTALTSDIVDTIGFLDLPTHILGRQSKTLNIWHDFCRGKSGVEPVSGLPYGLIDLFSTIAQPDVEFQFWTWTGAGIEANPVQRRAWDAIRFAGIICAREQQRTQTQLQPSPPTRGCPPTVTLVQAIVDCLSDLLHTNREEACSVLNLYLYPVFMAGTQCDLLSSAQKSCIERFWKDLLLDPEGEGGSGGGGQEGTEAEAGGGSPYVEAPLDILHEMWTNSKGGVADQIAREWGLEIGLF